MIKDELIYLKANFGSNDKNRVTVSLSHNGSTLGSTRTGTISSGSSNSVVEAKINKTFNSSKKLF